MSGNGELNDSCGTPIATAVGVMNCGRCLLAIPTPLVRQSVPPQSAKSERANPYRQKIKKLHVFGTSF